MRAAGARGPSGIHVGARVIEAALRWRNAGSHAGPSLHLGIHVGDVIHEENNFYGGAVNIASRIAGLLAAGETKICRKFAAKIRGRRCYSGVHGATTKPNFRYKTCYKVTRWDVLGRPSGN